MLRRVPGARVRQFGGLGQFATLSLRSSTAEQVAIHVDGVPQNRALGGAVDLSFLPATQLDSITVYRGFAPASAGTASLGGLVDIRTRSPGSGWEGDVNGLAGELESTRLTGSVAFTTGASAVHRLSGEWLRSAGDFEYLDTRETPFDPSDDVWRRRDNNDVEHAYGNWHSAWSAGDGAMALRLRSQTRQRGVAGVSSRPAGSARLDEDLTDLAWSWNRETAGALQKTTFAVDGFRQHMRFQDPEGELGARRDQSTELTGGGASALMRWWTAPHRLVARVEARLEEASVRDAAVEAADRGGARRRLLSATLEDVIPMGHWTLAPSLRAEWRSDRPQAAADGTLPVNGDGVQGGRGSGRLGVAWDAGFRCSLRGSAGSFFRNPNLVELFGDRGFVAGNPSLRPERGEALEAGTACSEGDRWQLETVLFARRVRDLIQFLPVSLGVAKAANLQEARVAGVEASGALRLAGGWTLEASGTLQQAEDATEGPTRGKPLVFQPRQLGWLSASWRRAGFTARWELTYVGENSTDRLDTPALRLPSRVLHDFFLAHDGPGGLRVALDVRNIFDRRTLDVQRYPLPGRVVFVSLGWRWGGEST